MDKSILGELSHLKNVDCKKILGKKKTGEIVEVDKQILIDFARFLDCFEDESAKKFHSEIMSVLVVPNVIVRIA